MLQLMATVVLCLVSLSANAVSYTFTFVIGSTDGSILGRPSINNSGTVAFQASNSTTTGIYTWAGGTLTTIADNSGPFGGFSDPSINNNGTVVFQAGAAGSGGLYTGSGGGLTLIAHNSGPLSGFGPSAINDNGTVAFRGLLDAGGEQVLSGNGGALTTIADTSGAFSSFGNVSINSAGTVAFQGPQTGVNGIYTGSGGSLTTIVEYAYTVAHVENNPSINNSGRVAFTVDFPTGPLSQTQTIFVGDGGILSMIVDTTGPFASVGNAAINDQDTVAFLANLDAGGQGIFSGPDPIADKVVGTGDILNSQVIQSIDFDINGLNDNGDVTFRAVMSDGSLAIFVASQVVPIPPAVWLLGSALGVMGWMRRKASS